MILPAVLALAIVAAWLIYQVASDFGSALAAILAGAFTLVIGVWWIKEISDLMVGSGDSSDEDES